MEVTLTIQNANQLMRTFNRAPAVASAEYKKSLERIAAKVTSEAQKLSPVGKHKGGGNLRQSIRYAPYGSYAYMVRVNASYGAYVEYGTKPHLIVPKTKKALAFNVGGNRVITKRVNHPGTKAQPFFRPAIKIAEDYAGKEMSSAMDRVLNQIK